MSQRGLPEVPLQREMVDHVVDALFDKCAVVTHLSIQFKKQARKTDTVSDIHLKSMKRKEKYLLLTVNFPSDIVGSNPAFSAFSGKLS